MDGQFTGFITKERRNFIYRAHWSRLLCFKASADRPAQKNATSDVISSQPIACPSYLITKLVMCCHRPGKSEVRSSGLTSTVITVPALQTRPCCRWVFVDCKVAGQVSHYATTDVISNQPIACPSDQQTGYVTRQTTIASKNSLQGLSQATVKSTDKTCD